MNKRLCVKIALLIFVQMTNACAHLITEPGFEYHGTTLKCLKSIPELDVVRVKDSAKLAVDVLRSDVFARRALAALAHSATQCFSRNNPELVSLRPEEKLAYIQQAALKGLSISTKSTAWIWSRTNAWDGQDDPDGICGRIVPLNRRKVDKRGPYLWAGTIVHEITHIAHFDHKTQSREGNECSIPHVLGDIVEWTAWELSIPAAVGEKPFSTWQSICASVAEVCKTDPLRRCHVETDVTVSSAN